MHPLPTPPPSRQRQCVALAALGLLVLLVVVLLASPAHGARAFEQDASEHFRVKHLPGLFGPANEEAVEGASLAQASHRNRRLYDGEGDGEVPFAMYAGSITVDRKNGGKIFYWLTESESNPERAPLVIWLSGGPGCSSEIALFDENGPFSVDNDLRLRENPYSWNKVANVLFIDQPVGTGLSPLRNDAGLVKSERTVGREMWIFLQGFLELYPHYRNRAMFIFGESYAGHYVPAVAAEVLRMNKRVRAGEVRARIIKIKGIGVGNGMTSPQIQYQSYAPFAYYHGLIDHNLYEFLTQKQWPRCKRAMAAGEPKEENQACNGIIGRIKRSHGSLNVYDVTKQCPPNNSLCYDFTPVSRYLSIPAVREALHVDDNAPRWKPCNLRVHRQFYKDWWSSQVKEVTQILRELPVLFYNGADDFICNFAGTDSWLRSMEWEYQEDFRRARRMPWKVDGETKGFMKRTDNLRFLVVFNAGHMVPMDQPVVALEMFRSFIYGDMQ